MTTFRRRLAVLTVMLALGVAAGATIAAQRAAETDATQRPVALDQRGGAGAGQRGGGAGAGGQRGRGGRGGGRFQRVPPLPFPTAPVVLDTLEGPIRVVPMVSGLENPWSLTWLPGGDMLVTEKPGRLRVVRNGQLLPDAVTGTPEVLARGQGGLLEVALHPQFATNQILYLTYSKSDETRGNTTALARGRLNGMALEGLEDIFVADAWSERSSIHFGSKLAFGPDGKLYMTVGERGEGQPSQDLMSHKGKILRLNDDGTVPADNPFVGRADAKPEIYSYGHRNMQGLAFHPVTGALWSTEHGPQGGDELNRIEAGKNYGWPIATHGREYSGVIITQQPYVEGMEPPVIALTPSLGLSGLAIYQGDAFPGWQGNFFLGGLSGLQIQRVGFTDEFLLVGMEEIAREVRQRIRDVRVGPDGLLYAVTDGGSGGILRIEPGGGSGVPGFRSSGVLAPEQVLVPVPMNVPFR